MRNVIDTLIKALLGPSGQTYEAVLRENAEAMQAAAQAAADLRQAMGWEQPEAVRVQARQ